MRVEISEQAFSFTLAQAPDPRRRLRRALRGLERETGDILALEGRLSGYWRLRTGPFRLIFRYVVRGKTRMIRCEFIERRSVVYEVFEQVVKSLKP